MSMNRFALSLDKHFRKISGQIFCNESNEAEIRMGRVECACERQTKGVRWNDVKPFEFEWKGWDEAESSRGSNPWGGGV